MARAVQKHVRNMNELPYVIVLAGGEGTRLAPLTRALYGTELPKQFAVLDGDRSLLQQTVERARSLTTYDRVLVVVTGHREAIAREQLSAYPGVELVVQPHGLDTGPGLLLPLARVLARDPDARVLFFPSDHHISNTGPLVAAVRAAARGKLAGRITLVGVTPTAPEVEYGWIVRGSRLGRTPGYAVDRFAEKPPQPVADELWRAGGLWNTFISAGPARAFWALARKHLPRHAGAFERYSRAIATSAEPVALAAAYRDMKPANFSRDILAHARTLAVVPVSDSGWSDWGSPRRVFESLAGTVHHARLVARIRGDVALALAS